MIENEIYRILTSTMASALTAMTSSRIYIGYAPQTITYPCVIMFLISRTDGHVYDIPAERIQFSCYGNTYSSSKQIAESILSVLKRLQGNIFSGSTITASTYTVYRSMYENLAYLYDDQVSKHVSILDMLVQYKY